jgi:hypothetical protein
VNEEQQQKMRADLDAKYEAQLKMKRASKIEQMEKSVLVGGVNLVDRAK